MQIDMWYGDKFELDTYYADAYFYPHGSFGYCYRGNIYNCNGETIGDYSANSSEEIEKHFRIVWK